MFKHIYRDEATSRRYVWSAIY